MPNPEVLIVGAGPSGLNLALRLNRHGVPFRIIDKNSGPGQASRALAVHARTLELYGQLGFADEIVDKGIKVEVVHLREGGHEVARMNLKDMGQGLSPFPFMLVFPQDDHERFLVEKLNAAGIGIEWNTELVGFTQDEAKVSATLKTKNAEEHAEISYLCGCDGARSRVRENLALGFPGGTYDHLYYVADVKTAGEQTTDGFINLGAKTFALMMPVRSTGMQRLIGIVPDRPNGQEDLTFEDVKPEAETLIGIKVEHVNWFSTYRVHHRVASHFRVGRCFIAGDAGHIHSPTGGQGMNTGIGDAVNLAWKLAFVLQGRADPSLLDTYEAERIVFARFLVDTTDRAFQILVSQGVGGDLFRKWLLPHAMSFLTGFSAARRAVFKTISQVKINYEHSPLSEGEAGDVEGGDRLPWVLGASGADNFASLRFLDWQIHVYGQVDAPFKAAADAAGIPLNAFAWTAAAKEAGLKEDAAYLIRPDSYVALAMPSQNPDAIRDYATRFALKFAHSSGT